jgi:hypothetical protein
MHRAIPMILRACAGLALLIAVLWLAAIAAVPVKAHGDADWIMGKQLRDPASGAWCCGEVDCARQPAGAVEEVEGGFRVVETGETIPFARIIWQSPTGEWWRCVVIESGVSKTRCLIGPPRGT